MSWLARPVPEAAPGFEAFVTARRAPMILMARALVRHDADAEDLVHEVLASALVRWRRVGASDDPVAYVDQVLVNAAISWFRKPARRERPAEDSVIDARRVTATTRDPAVDGAGRGDRRDPGHGPADGAQQRLPRAGRPAQSRAGRRQPARARPKAPDGAANARPPGRLDPLTSIEVP